jgi:hypothetical protein
MSKESDVLCASHALPHTSAYQQACSAAAAATVRARWRCGLLLTAVFAAAGGPLPSSLQEATHSSSGSPLKLIVFSVSPA